MARVKGPSEFVKTAFGLYLLGRASGWLMMVIVERQVHWLRLAERRPFRNWHEMMVRWDAFYYQIIATSGYPPRLPVDANGAVVQNPWAFFPVFPYAVRGAAGLTGFSFETAAVIVNFVAGAAAAVCLAQLARAVAGEPAGLRTVAFWSFFPTAFVLQVPYSEALYAAFAAACLLTLLRQRYWLAALLLAAASLTKGYGPSLSAAALVVVGSSLRPGGKARLPDEARPGVRVRAGAIALTVSALLAPFVWMTVADAVTGEPGAYSATQRAWGYSRDAAVWRDRWVEMLDRLNPVDLVSLLTLAAALALSIAVLWMRRLPAALKIYTLTAAGLIAATALPGAVSFTSLPRFALGVVTFPLILGMLSTNRWVTIGIVSAFVGLEFLWILNIWTGLIGIAP